MAKKTAAVRATTGTTTRAGYIPSIREPKPPPGRDYVVAELKYEAPIALAAGHFGAPAEARPQADKLNDILERYGVKAVRSQLGVPASALRSRVEVARTLPKAPEPSRYKDRMDTTFIHSGFVQIVPKRDADAAKIADALKRQNAVWDAYVAPRPVPAIASGSAAGSRNFEPAQGYLDDPPNGVGACGVWGLAGAKGAGITICDIEGDWNRKHEDLPTGIKLLGGTLMNDIGWRNHGTAVLGEMVAQRNAFGCIGISHDARAAVQSFIINGVSNVSGAIANAASVLKPGDVILIELHAPSPLTGRYIAMQYWNDIFSAIVAATQKGITVVEAAGNGNENFDLAIYNGSGLQKDSGAVVVGAGVPPTNYRDVDGAYQFIGVPRSRIWFSNYGKMVNVHGWGWHVTTLAYGDAQGDASENKWYTLRFSGTSSASPIVKGCVACIQGRSRSKNGAPLTPDKVRQILMKTGTPQEPGPGVPVAQRIGPLPDLIEAMKLV